MQRCSLGVLACMLSCARVSADNSALSYNQSNQSELTCAEMQDIGMDPWLRDLLYDAYKVSLGPLHRTKCYYLGAMCALPKNHGYGGCDLSEEDTVCKAWFKPGYKISQLMFVLMFVALVSAFFTGGASCLVYLAVAAVANSVALVIMALCLLGLVFGTALVILATFIMMPVFPLLDYYEIWHVHYEILFCWRGASFSKFIFFPQLVLILQPLKNLGKAVDIAEEAKPATYGPISLSKLGLRLTNYGLENLKQANNAVNDWGNLLLLDCPLADERRVWTAGLSLRQMVFATCITSTILLVARLTILRGRQSHFQVFKFVVLVFELLPEALVNFVISSGCEAPSQYVYYTLAASIVESVVIIAGVTRYLCVSRSGPQTTFQPLDNEVPLSCLE